MEKQESTTLALSRRVLRALVVVNVLYGTGILALLVASLAAPDPVLRALGVRSPANNPDLVAGMRTLAVIGIASVPIAHLILARLTAIVDSVRAGDPFVYANATRLENIAWAVLSLEILHFIAGAVAAAASSDAEPLDINWSFSLTRWIAVLMLFVLARVFERGARMREDLEGTV